VAFFSRPTSAAPDTYIVASGTIHSRVDFDLQHPQDFVDMSSRRQFVIQAAAMTAAPFISTSVTRALAAASKKKLGFAL